MRFQNLVILLVVFALAGCGGARKYYEKHETVDILTSDQKEVTVRVLAEADEWLNSGVVVKAGKQYRIEASGKWHGGPTCGWTGPDGIGAAQWCFFHIVPGWSISTLIARIDKGRPFAIGGEYTLIAPRDGVLQFHINDPESTTRDNQGYVNVKISTPRERQEVIDVKIIGYHGGRKTNKQRDYREAVVNAKRQAIERAGVEVKSRSRLRDFKLEEDYIETQSQGVLLPGYEITDLGYGEDGTYSVMLIGKIKVASPGK